jgi:ribosomal peptide maturation radical SAM protein 1
MKIALVAMPWAGFSVPSAAIGALAAYLKREEPGLEVTSHSEFLSVVARLGVELYKPISWNRGLAESISMTLLYPERQARARGWFAEEAARTVDEAAARLGDVPGGWPGAFDESRAALAASVERLAAELAHRVDVVGLTTSMGQTFSSLALARAVKQRAPSVVTVLGGNAMREGAGPTFLREFDFVDYVVRGEGEAPLLALVRALRDGTNGAAAHPGLLSRRDGGGPADERWEPPDLDALPLPDYEEYAARADRQSILWHVPVEGSRGCWHDRTFETGDVKDKCRFCSFGYSRYRHKTPARLAAELHTLATRHRNVRIALTDISPPPRLQAELARCCREAGPATLSLYMAARASLTPYELLCLHELGVYRVNFGIEGLSASYLRRIHKGVAVIQNLQVMRTADELGIYAETSLIGGFPGSTRAEAEETVANVRRYAIAYHPAGWMNEFLLTYGSSVAAAPAEFGLTRVRAFDGYRAGLPEAVHARLQLTDLSFDLQPPAADWSDLVAACDEWSRLQDGLATDTRHPCRHALYYLDGGEFLEVVDRRHGCCSVTLNEPWRSIYLHCLEIRRRSEIGPALGVAPDEVDEALRFCLEHEIVFAEGDLCLALAVAPTTEQAARRIRAAEAARAARGRDVRGQVDLRG